VYVAPDVFSQDDDDGIVILLVERPAASLSETVKEAARQCPSMAIQLEET
jgi:ferredoxin